MSLTVIYCLCTSNFIIRLQPFCPLALQSLLPKKGQVKSRFDCLLWWVTYTGNRLKKKRKNKNKSPGEFALQLNLVLRYGPIFSFEVTTIIVLLFLRLTCFRCVFFCPFFPGGVFVFQLLVSQLETYPVSEDFIKITFVIDRLISNYNILLRLTFFHVE